MNIGFIVPYWDTVTQRPHHLVREAGRAGHVVRVYALDRGKESPGSDVVTQQHDRVLRYRPVLFLRVLLRLLRRVRCYAPGFRWAWGRFLRTKALSPAVNNVIIYSGPPISRVPYPEASSIFIYDCLDDWAAFYGNRSSEVSSWEDSLASSANAVVVVSPALRDKFVRVTSKDQICLIPNGCDYGHFAAVQPCCGEEVVIGYTGTIGSWFDWRILNHVAQMCPEWQIRLAGPVHGGGLPAALPSNVEYLGKRPYAAIPSLLSGFDVCIIPFAADSELVPAVSPIKLYEYLAAGRVVVSTSMPDAMNLRQAGVVHVADSPAQFLSELKAAVSVARDPALIERRRKVASSHSWASRWVAFEALIRQSSDKETTGSTNPPVSEYSVTP